jgi:hypothetical protein
MSGRLELCPLRQAASTVVAIVAIAILFQAVPATAQTFYPDDPLEREPTPLPVADLGVRNLSLLLEALSGVIGQPGERHPAGGVIGAQGVNTMGEVMNGPWFVNRHGRTRMSTDALVRGAGDDHPPSTEEPWQVMLVRSQGARPGMVFRDAHGRVYLLQFDPPEAPELATGAEMIASRFFHALGYHVPEIYLVRFGRDQLVPTARASDVTSAGGFRELLPGDIDRFLKEVARNPDGTYRAVAMRVPTNIDALIGPAQLFGTRSDDPNDIVPHEHRRDLRGLHVFSAWLNHTRFSPLHTFDAVLTVPGESPHVQHYLFDFTATLGSGRTGAKPAWEGRDSVYDRGRALRNVAGLGIYTPEWMRASYPDVPAVGRFESETFEPDEWTTRYDLAPFANRLPDDTFWAAKQVMAFRDEDIRAIVSVAQYSDRTAEAWVAAHLIERRDRIGRAYFARVLPLDRFAVHAGELSFEDLAVVHDFATRRSYLMEWSRFDNLAGMPGELIGSATASLQVPAVVISSTEGAYFLVRVRADGEDSGKFVSVYLRQEAGGLKVVGLDRAWPGRTLVDPRVRTVSVRNRYAELEPERRALFDTYARRLNASSGEHLSPDERFRGLPLSEQTTFDGVTHALMRSPLTDEQGRPLGRALDLVAGVERIAGQYEGRGGDQQFRLYVTLRPDARDLLQQSREFVAGHENTVYHIGYPHSFRLGHGVPSVQFSLSDDGSRADVDVDYRTSKAPQSLFNGHLTSSNSDVRAGDNAQRHGRRWNGFVSWWQDTFGHVDFKESSEGIAGVFEIVPTRTSTPLPPNRPANVSIPELPDAVQEFLADWLIRRNDQDVLAFFAPDVLACVADSLEIRARASQAELQQAARKLVRDTATAWGRPHTLADAMKPVTPWSPVLRVVSHAFEQDFTIVEVPDRIAAQYSCGAPAPTHLVIPDVPRYGTHYAALLQVVVDGRPGGTLALGWRRDAGEWRLVFYTVFR